MGLVSGNCFPRPVTAGRGREGRREGWRRCTRALCVACSVVFSSLVAVPAPSQGKTSRRETNIDRSTHVIFCQRRSPLVTYMLRAGADCSGVSTGQCRIEAAFIDCAFLSTAVGLGRDGTVLRYNSCCWCSRGVPRNYLFDGSASATTAVPSTNRRENERLNRAFLKAPAVHYFGM